MIYIISIMLDEAERDGRKGWALAFSFSMRDGMKLRLSSGLLVTGWIITSLEKKSIAGWRNETEMTFQTCDRQTDPHAKATFKTGCGKKSESGAMTRQPEYKVFLLCSLLNTLVELGTDWNNLRTAGLSTSADNTHFMSQHVPDDRWLFQTLNCL